MGFAKRKKGKYLKNKNELMNYKTEVLFIQNKCHPHLKKYINMDSTKYISILRFKTHTFILHKVTSLAPPQKKLLRVLS